tara:strand:- start:326 stop:583 length:258 start_codon:yes stop_codon:yes gene_type:complete
MKSLILLGNANKIKGKNKKYKLGFPYIIIRIIIYNIAENNPITENPGIINNGCGILNIKEHKLLKYIKIKKNIIVILNCDFLIFI